MVVLSELQCARVPCILVSLWGSKCQELDIIPDEWLIGHRGSELARAVLRDGKRFSKMKQLRQYETEVKFVRMNERTVQL